MTQPTSRRLATEAKLADDLATKVDTSTYVEGLATKQATATLDAAVAPLVADVDSQTAVELRAAFGTIYTPQQYGGDPTGAVDATAAIQAAVTAAEAAAADGRSVTVLLDGVFKLASSTATSVSLSRNNDGSRGWVNIIGARGAKVVLTAQTPRFLHLNKVADYDTFQKIRVEGIEIDAGNVPGYGAAIIGNVRNTGEQLTRLNFARIVVRDVRAYNLYEEASTATSARTGVQIIGAHPAALEATRTSTIDVLVEGVDVYGGSGGVNVCSYGANLVGGVNHYYDNIRIRRCRHEIATPPTINGGQTSFFIAGCGFGDYCEIADVYSKNISDDGIEVGAMQTVLIERARIEDAFLEHILFRNFHALQDVTRQVITVIDPLITSTPAGIAASPASFTRQVPFNFKPENPFGTIRLIRPRIVVDGQSSTHSFPTGNAYFIGVNAGAAGEPGASVQALEILSPRLVFKNFTIDRPTVQDIQFIYFHSAATNARLLVRDLVARLDGLTIPATAAANLSLIRVEGNADVDIDGVTAILPPVTFTTGGSLRLVDVGRSVVGSIAGRIKGLRPKTGNVSGAGIYGVYTSSTATLAIPGEIVVAESDFSGMANVSSEVRIDATQVGKVRTSNLRARTGPPAAATPAVGASPWTYLNSTGETRQLTVAGGTVTLIELQGVTGAFVTTGLTSGVFNVRPGHRVRITYAAAPTVTEVA